MKRKSLATLAAALPIATLAIGSVLAEPPKAMASQLASPAATVQQVALRGTHYVIIVVTEPWLAASGIKAKTPAEAAKSLDS